MLLAADDPPPVQVINPTGASRFLLLGDHAGNVVPHALGTLGLSEEELTRHIAWDIGIAALGEMLSAALDAVFIRQAYSRLVIDCNRDPSAPDAVPAVSDGTPVPGNTDLTVAERNARIAGIHAPYHAMIAAELNRRDAVRRETIVVSLHSFTSRFQCVERPWEIGILYSGGNSRFAQVLLRLLIQCEDLCVGENQPYAMDSTDHTVPRHAFASDRPYAEIEIRQDLLAEPNAIERWCRLLAALIPRSAA